MIKRLSFSVLCASVFLVSCSKRERSTADDAEWADVQPIADVPAEAPGTNASMPEVARRIIQSEGENYAPLIQRLDAMQQIERGTGETLITGEALVFDYERRAVRMDQDVKVVDDRGELETEMLTGRFSEDNKVEMIEARKGVRIVSGARAAKADTATYAFQSGAIELDGNAHVAEGANKLSGERIRFWIKGSRRMVCEPNALLEIAGGSGFDLGGVSPSGGVTEIRSDQVVYDESQALVEFDGNVRVRDPRAAMNCEKVLLHLKENNEIDWIEALSEVIIQSDDRKALAKRASYMADEGKFVLEGDPKVKQGQNIMTGDRITFWQDTRRMVCEPNARVLLYPDAEMKAKFLKDLKD